MEKMIIYFVMLSTVFSNDGKMYQIPPGIFKSTCKVNEPPPAVKHYQTSHWPIIITITVLRTTSSC